MTISGLPPIGLELLEGSCTSNTFGNQDGTKTEPSRVEKGQTWMHQGLPPHSRGQQLLNSLCLWPMRIQASPRPFSVLLVRQWRSQNFVGDIPILKVGNSFTFKISCDSKITRGDSESCNGPTSVASLRKVISL